MYMDNKVQKKRYEYCFMRKSVNLLNWSGLVSTTSIFYQEWRTSNKLNSPAFIYYRAMEAVGRCSVISIRFLIISFFNILGFSKETPKIFLPYSIRSGGSQNATNQGKFFVSFFFLEL